MNVPLVVAGSLSLLGSAIHGGAGEVLLVSKLTPSMLPATRFADRSGSKALIRGAWHLATVGLVTVGVALILAGTAVRGDTARGMTLVAASAASGFAMVVIAGAIVFTPRSLFRHPAPVLLGTVAVLAWLGLP